MDIKDVVTFIIRDNSVSTNEGLNSIITAIKERQRINRATNKAFASATLHIGDEVIVSGISPKYLNGMKGVITGFNKTRSRADIRITDNKGEYRVAVGANQRGYPVQCLSVINTSTASYSPEVDETLLDFLEA